MTDEQKRQVVSLRQEGGGYTSIANKLGISRDTVKSFCRRNGLSGEMGKEQGQSRPQGRCRECGRELFQEDGIKKRIFCSKECREKWWKAHPEQIKKRAVYSFTCAGCGKAFTAYGNSGRKYCSHECYIKDRFGGVTDHE